MTDFHFVCDPQNPEFSLKNSAFYLIAQADFKYHEDLAKVLAKYGMDRTIYRLLTVLREKSPMCIGEIAEFAFIPRSTVSRAIERMKAEGWVETGISAADNRTIDVAFTDAGREALEKVIHLGSRQFQRAMDELPNEDLGRLISILKHIIANLSKLPIE